MRIHCCCSNRSFEASPSQSTTACNHDVASSYLENLQSPGIRYLDHTFLLNLGSIRNNTIIFQSKLLFYFAQVNIWLILVELNFHFKDLSVKCSCFFLPCDMQWVLVSWWGILPCCPSSQEKPSVLTTRQRSTWTSSRRRNKPLLRQGQSLCYCWCWPSFQ